MDTFNLLCDFFKNTNCLRYFKLEKEKKLIDAMKKKDFRTVKKLIYQGEIDVSSTGYFLDFGSGWNILHYAVSYENKELVQFILNHSEIQINKSDNYGWTPLHLAVLIDRYDIVKILLKHGSSKNKMTIQSYPLLPKSYFKTPYNLAKKLNRVSLLRLLDNKKN